MQAKRYRGQPIGNATLGHKHISDFDRLSSVTGNMPKPRRHFYYDLKKDPLARVKEYRQIERQTARLTDRQTSRGNTSEYRL